MTPRPRERRGGVAEVNRLSGAGHGGAVTGPMGYPAKPEAMGALISTVFADRLLERGVKYARVGLMTVFVQERVGAELARMERCPAHEAIGRALGVVAEAWDQAMTVHGMFPQTIDECQRMVRVELEELVEEHIAFVKACAAAPEPDPRHDEVP
jgi:predicted DNA repair protein MutK